MARKRIALLVAGAVVAVVLTPPLCNLVPGRTMVEVQGGPGQFARVSSVLQQKCVDCHALALARLPWYGRLPLAKGLIERDQGRGAASWKLERAEVAGQQPLSDVSLAKLEWVVGAGEMPPPQYLALHWEAFVAAGDRAAVSEYITAVRAETPEGKRMAPAHRGEPVQVLLAPVGLVPDKVELGKILFHDQRLSGDNSLSCASCHALNKGGTDQAPVSTGIRGQKGGVNDPSVYNASYNIAQFWDGRAKDLSEQAGGPVENPVEMGARFPAVVEKLKQVDDYGQRFGRLYPGEGISKRTITDVIAEFEKSLVTVGSRFDRYLGGDEGAITEQEKQGYAVFKSAGCSACHFGPAVGGRSYERFGVFRDYFADRGKIGEEDWGRFNVTHQESDRYRFKVPILRNVTVTHPYFHDASAQDLKQAVTVMARYQLEDTLSDQAAGLIVQFLQSLTGNYQGKPVDRL